MPSAQHWRRFGDQARRADFLPAGLTGRFSLDQAQITGIPAGVPDEKGSYPADTVYGKVQAKLKYYLKQSLKLKGRTAAERWQEGCPSSGEMVSARIASGRFFKLAPHQQHFSE
jgi:hypothetical protein